MRRDGQRGFTLIEIGIVIAIIALLTTAIVATSGRSFENARADRTAKELDGILRASVDALKRNVQVTAGTSPSYSYLSPNPVVLQETVPVCYDLAAGGSKFCAQDLSHAVSGVATVAGAFAGVTTNPNNPLLSMYSGNRPNNGFNAWCESYVVCLYAHRVDVATCVPTIDVNAGRLEGLLRCGDCGTRSPITNEPTTCVFASSVAISGASNSRFSYSESLINLPLANGL